MCGRFTRGKDSRTLSRSFDIPGDVPEIAPSGNVSPTQKVAVVGLKPDGKTRGLAALRWGLVPNWSNGPKSVPLHFNAKAETVDKLPTFRDCFRHKRCLVPADGFYEWLKTGERVKDGKKWVEAKVPHLFRLRGGEPFGFAGLWDSWTDGTTTIVSCCILTVTPNELVAPVHDRMPLILPREQYGRWLSNDTPVAELLTLLRPFPADDMEAETVGPDPFSPSVTEKGNSKAGLESETLLSRGQSHNQLRGTRHVHVNAEISSRSPTEGRSL